MGQDLVKVKVNVKVREWEREREKEKTKRARVVWRAPVAPHSLYQALCFAFDQMSWPLGWKVGSTLRCRVVLSEVRHWKLGGVVQIADTVRVS